MSSTTPLGAVWRGVLSGAAGTAAMDLFLYGRHRLQGGSQDLISWEFGGPSEWEEVSAPAQVGRRLYEGYTQRPLPERRARLTNNVMHWGYGIAWGTIFGIIAGSLPKARAGAGPLFGAAVWGSGYVLLPVAGLYKPIWKYRPAELAPDLAAHRVYGAATALCFRASRASGS